MALPATNVVRAVPGRSTIRVMIHGTAMYLKRYERGYLSPAKKFLRLIHWPGCDDEAAREWRKMHLLRQHGFLTATPVALGRRGFASFLLQQEIAGGVPADEHLQTLATPQRRQLLRQVGELARRLRAAGFIHKDLYLKHIFVAGGELYLIDLQRVLGPRRHRERWYLKDAAALAFSLRAHGKCSWTDVMRVYKAYAPGKTDKNFIRQLWPKITRLLNRTPKYKRVWNS
ncbi:MAG: lipopolysaccharide kinase InaA family protein [Verrucomicrobiota bacterium]